MPSMVFVEILSLFNKLHKITGFTCFETSKIERVIQFFTKSSFHFTPLSILLSLLLSPLYLSVYNFHTFSIFFQDS